MAGCHCEFRGMAGCTPSGIERLGRLQPRPDSPPSVFLVTGRTAPFLTSPGLPWAPSQQMLWGFRSSLQCDSFPCPRLGPALWLLTLTPRGVQSLGHSSQFPWAPASRGASSGAVRAGPSWEMAGPFEDSGSSLAVACSV